jgi:hypothetical protein
MIAAMSKLMILSGVAIFSLSGCGSQSATSSAPARPTSDVDVEFHEPAASEPEASNNEAGKPEADKPGADKSDSDKSDSDKPGKAQAGKSETNSKTNAAKKGCAGLKQDTCQITMGCAWSTKKVCVDQ